MQQNIIAKKNQNPSRPLRDFSIGLVAFSTVIFALISLGYAVEWLGIDMLGEPRHLLSGPSGRALGLFLVGKSAVLMIAIVAFIIVAASFCLAQLGKLLYSKL